MNSPIDSFSAASSSVRSNSIVGIGAWLRRDRDAASGAARRRRDRGRRSSPGRSGVLLGLLAGRLGLLEHRQHALAAGAGRAERAALDQRLDRLLVDRAAVDPLAEVEQVGERTVLLARPLDRLDRRVADALDRVEPEADVAVDDDELVV